MTDSQPTGSPIGDALLASLNAPNATPAPAAATPGQAELDRAAQAAPVEHVAGPPVLVPEVSLPAPVLAAPSAPVAAPTAEPTPATVPELVAASIAARAVADQRVLVPGNAGVPTQVANPRRTTWRTWVQSAIGILIVGVPLANAALVAVTDYLKGQHETAVPPWMFVALNGGIAATTVAIAIVTRIMLVPGVADFIARYLPFLAPVKKV